MFPKKRQSINVRITTDASNLTRDAYAGSKPDDEAQWFFLMCVRELRKPDIGGVRGACVADSGKAIEFTGRISVPNGTPTESVLEAISSRIPGSTVSSFVTPPPAMQKLAA